MMTMMPDPARYEEMVFQEGRRRGREEATAELMAWHDRVCEEMAKRHTADRPKGEWIFRREFVEDTPFTGCRCSNCNYWKDMGIWNYCPNCGAYMKGADDE